MTTIKAYNVDTRDFEYVKQNNTGLLISGGGSGGGDASSTNQVSSNLALSSRLDTINTTLQNSNLAIWSKINVIEELNIDLLESVDGINLKLNPLQIQSANYTIEAVTQFAPDTAPQFTKPPPGINNNNGWYYKNLVNGQVSQLYFYSYLNPAMSVAGRQFAYQLNDITMSYCVVRLIAVNSTAGLVTLAIYTRPTGSGDSVPGFFKSRRVYNIPSNSKLTQGMQVMLYWGVEPNLKLHPGVARIQLQLASTTGPALGTEQVGFLSLNTDSASLAGNSEYIVSAAGFQYGSELIMNNEFTGESSQPTQPVSIASSVAVTGDFYQATQPVSGDFYQATQPVSIASSVAVTGDFYQATQPVSGDFYQTTQPVSIASSVAVTGDFYQATQPVSIASSVAVTGDFYQATQPVSGDFYQATQPVSIASSVAVTGDFATETTVSEIQIQTDKLSYYPDAYGAFDLRTQVMNELGVSVNNTPTVTLSGGSEVGLISGTQVGLAAGAQVQLVSSEVGLSAGSTVSLSAGSTVDVGNFPQKQSVFVENSSEGFDLNVNVTNASIDVGNFPQKQSVFVENTAEGFDINVNVTNASLAITTTAPIDTHNYASNDGTTWHHLASDVNGRLNVNSRAHDGTGNDITSTAVSGTETWRGLDVAVKNNVSVNNQSGTQLFVKARQYGSFGNVANNIPTMLPSAVTAGIDVTDWSYIVGAYEDTTSTTTGNAIGLQYSFDNITYRTLFNTQIFPSGTGTRRAVINKQDIPGVNWVRLINNTSSTLSSVTLTLLGGSLS